MNKFIVLHLKDNGDPVYINTDHISYYFPSDDGTLVSLLRARLAPFEVTESCKDISYMIGNIVTKK